MTLRKTPIWPVLVVCAVPFLMGMLQIIIDGGLGNVKTAAAALSMSQGWPQFLFGAADAAASVTIGGPPLALWPQAGLVRLLGLSPWAIRLPQVLAASLCCMAAWAAVRKSLGEEGFVGLIAALALACAPVLAAVSGSADGDVWAVLCLFGVAWLAFSAIDRESGWLLALALALAGLAFNILLLPALSILPAVAALWFTGQREKPKGWSFFFALILFAIIALAWFVPVQLIAAQDRPFIGGSIGNSVFSLLLERASAGQPDGWLRFVGSDWGAVTVWLLPFSFAGGLFALVCAIADSPQNGWRSARAQAFWLVWAVCAAMMLYATSAPSPRHLLVLLPALAGLFAHSAALLIGQMEKRPSACLAMAVALFIGGIAQTRWLGVRAQWGSWLIVFTLGACGVALVLGVMYFLKHAEYNAKRLVAVLGLLCLLGSPAVWSGTALFWQGGNPVKEAMHTVADRRNSAGQYTAAPQLLAWLMENKGSAEYLCAAPDSKLGAALAVDSGCKVLYYGGLTGEENCVSSALLKAMVKDGRLRWFILPSEGSALAELSNYAHSCVEVPSVQWFGGSDPPYIIFDMASSVETR